MTASDKELLELAAKAAGYELDFNVPDNANPWVMTGVKGGDDYGPGFAWNPLSDDGDAFRLMNRCRISIEFTSCLDDAPIVICKTYFDDEIRLEHFPDSAKQLRKCIVAAAIEHGEKMGVVI